MDCKKIYTVYDDNNAVANIGGNKGDIIINDKKSSEYFGLSIELLEDLPPILTNVRIDRAIKFYKNNEIQNTINTLGLSEYVIKYDTDVIKYTLTQWCNINNIIVPAEFKTKKIYNDKRLNEMINAGNNHPLIRSFKIISVGTFLPENFINLTFLNGEELHKKMDMLDSRKRKPPTTYCLIYSLTVLKKNVWTSKPSCLKSYKYFITLKNINECTIIYGYTDGWFDNAPKRFISNDDLIIAIDDSIVSDDENYKKSYNTGFLSSTLQKCMRRGSKCSQLLLDTIDKLSVSPPYVLPDLNFTRVSSSRQLVWRLFISIIEDCDIFMNDILSIEYLACLSILLQLYTKLKLKNDVIDKLKLLALNIQHNESYLKWFDEKEYTGELKSNTLLFFDMIINKIHKMKNDNILIRRCMTASNKVEFKHLKIKPIKDILKYNDIDFCDDVLYRSMDNHCNPSIIILFQCLLNIDDIMTTKEISKFIWEYNSKINYRLNNEKYDIKCKLLYDIQKILVTKKYEVDYDSDEYLNTIAPTSSKSNIDINSKLAFTLLFGETYKMYSKSLSRNVDIYLSDSFEIKLSTEQDISINLNGSEYEICLKEYYEKLSTGIKVVLRSPPENHSWIFSDKHVKLSYNNGFYVNDISISPDNMNNVIYMNDSYEQQKLSKIFEKLIINTLESNITYNEIELIRTISKKRKSKKDFTPYKWCHLSNIPINIYKYILSKLTINDDFYFGPIDRSGSKTDNAIDYKYEGMSYRITLMLSCLYPDTLQEKTLFKFKINRNSSNYGILINSLHGLIYEKKYNYEINNTPKLNNTVNLWTNQKDSVDKITYNLFFNNKKGIGLANDTGSGKTLIGISTIINIFNQTKDNKYKGFLILVPNINLIDVWKKELLKHTTGFDVIIQSSSGVYTTIYDNSIVISTTGRHRDHYIYNNFRYMIVDECLCVSNKEALQTMAVLNQSITSQYGILLLSATFFRSKFDKLYYLLKMLNSKLPIEKNFLDTILANSMICKNNKTDIKWEDQTRYAVLSSMQIEVYNNIIKDNKDNNKIYSMLNNFINDSVDYIKIFYDKINEIENEINNCKILIFVKSKREEDEALLGLQHCSLYPDKSKRHVIVSYQRGSHGLNDLVDYNVILSRGVQIDLRHQQKGRLERYGQQSKVLYYNQIILKNTIEENILINHKIAEDFNNKYIAPITEIY